MRQDIVLKALCACLLLFCCACRRSADPHRFCDRAQSANSFSIQIDRPYYVDKFSNLFSEVRYVPLEETCNSIVGEISRLEITRGGDYIVLDSRSGAVFRFASDGSFLNNIGLRGPGENEYVLPSDMVYDPYTDKVLVWDNGKSSILTYGLDGKMESRIQLPWIIDKFGVIDASHLICYMNNGEFLRWNEFSMNYKIISREGVPEKEFGEYGYEKSGFSPAARRTFYTYAWKCSCFPPLSSTLFRVEGDTLNAVASFDLLESAIPPEWMKGTMAEFREKLSDYPNLIEIASVFETNQCYILKLIKHKSVMQCLIQKETKQVRSICTNILNDMYGLVASTSTVCSDNDKLYYAIDPSLFCNYNDMIQALPEGMNLKELFMRQACTVSSYLSQTYGDESATTYVDSLKVTNFTLSPGERTFIDEMSQKNNPIIQICTLK